MNRAERRRQQKEANRVAPRRIITALPIGDPKSDARVAEIIADLESMLAEPGISYEFRREVEADLANAKLTQLVLVAADPARPKLGAMN